MREHETAFVSTARRAADSVPLTRARRRAAAAKVALVAGSGVVFAVGTVLAKSSYASHPKHHQSALAAPPAFVGIVRRNLLEAGAVAPPEAPPVAETATS